MLKTSMVIANQPLMSCMVGFATIIYCFQDVTQSDDSISIIKSLNSPKHNKRSFVLKAGLALPFPIDEKEAKIYVQIKLSAHILTDPPDPHASGTQDRFRHAHACPQFERPARRTFVVLP